MKIKTEFKALILASAIFVAFPNVVLADDATIVRESSQSTSLNLDFQVDATARQLEAVKSALMAYYTENLYWPTSLSLISSGANPYYRGSFATPLGNITGAPSGANNYQLKVTDTITQDAVRKTQFKLLAGKQAGTFTEATKTMNVGVPIPHSATIVRNMLSRLPDATGSGLNTMQTDLDMGGFNVNDIAELWVNKVSATDVEAVNTKTTNLTATTGTVTNLTSTNANIQNGTVTNLTSTNGTVTNLTSTDANITNGVVTNLTSTDANIANGVVTNLTSTDANIKNGTVTNLTSTDANIENGVVKNLTSTDANITNGTVTNLTSTDANIKNVTSTNTNTTNLTATTGEISTLVSTTGNITNLTSVNASLANIKANDIETDDLTARNLATTNGTVTNLTSTNANVKNLTVETAVAKTINADLINVSSLKATKLIAGKIQTTSGADVDTNKTLANKGITDAAFVLNLIEKENGLDDRMADIEIDYLAMNTRVGTNETNIKYLTDRVSDNEAAIATNKADITALKTKDLKLDDEDSLLWDEIAEVRGMISTAPPPATSVTLYANSSGVITVPNSSGYYEAVLGTSYSATVSFTKNCGSCEPAASKASKYLSTYYTIRYDGSTALRGSAVLISGNTDNGTFKFTLSAGAKFTKLLTPGKKFTGLKTNAKLTLKK